MQRHAAHATCFGGVQAGADRFSSRAFAGRKIGPMQSETRHHEYRTWAELAAAAKTDTRAWLYLLETAPWAVKLLEAAPSKPH
jgi:hypothetical protein